MNQRRRRWAGRATIGLAIALGLALWLAPQWSWGRAGGGGSYHSSGGGHSSSSGSSHSSGGSSRSGRSSGDGVDWFFLVYWLVVHPVIGVPLLILVVWVVYHFGRGSTGGGGNGGVPRSAVGFMPGDEREAAIARIRAHDPAFDEAAFCARVRTAFDKIQMAWSGQNLTAVRPFISDGVYERFSLQIDEQRAAGYRDHMEDVRIEAIHLASVAASGLFDEASVRIAAAARDWRESLTEPGRRISGSAGVEPFVEVWTFLRRRGAVTDVSRAGLIEGNCPNCGAAVEMNQSARCTHCKAELRSGEFDWVLTEITQEVEWSAPRRDDIPGVAELQSRDPGFDPASIEDRGSVMFWRRATAERIAKVDPVRKVALPAFVEAYQASMRQRVATGQRAFVADCGVGSVETRGVASDGQWDRAVLEVRWSGKRFVADGAGAVRPVGDEVWASELFVLVKRSAAPTDPAKSISSAHCPNCGAPESGGTSNACEFCGTVLNDGAHGWVLERTAMTDEPDGQQLLAEVSRPMA